MKSVTLQNSVRLRIFLILVLSIAIRFIRPFTSTSVHKATAILEINYLLYGLVLLCTLMPFKSAWIIAAGSVVLTSLIGGVSLLLGIIATSRCFTGEQVGCVQNAPADISSLAFVGTIVVLDLLQSWAAYRILRIPSFVASASQRIRILFCWAWPFAWMVNIVLWSESKWSFWTLPHLFIDPTLIVLANTEESLVILVIIFAVIFCDAIALLTVNVQLARWGLLASLGLTCGGLLMQIVPVSKDAKRRETVAQAVDVTEVKGTPTLRKRQNKSQTKEIAF